MIYQTLLLQTNLFPLETTQLDIVTNKSFLLETARLDRNKSQNLYNS